MGEFAHALEPGAFAAVFPFHVVFDPGLRIRQLGPSIVKACPELALGASWLSHFEILRPTMSEPGFEQLRERRRAVFLVRHRSTGLTLRGQIVFSDSPAVAFFLCSPHVTDLSELGALGVGLNDYPLHDASADLLFLLRSRDVAMAEAKAFAARLQQQSVDLARAKHAAETANHAKSQFLATMSHEIRTPLNGILGTTELLLRAELPASQRECVEIISASGKTLMALIGDILDFSKIEAGMMPIEARRFELRSLLREVVSMFGPAAQRQAIELRCRVAEDVPVGVVADPGRLRQILTNLMGNAVKFTEAGTVDVRVALRLTSDGDPQLLFEVEDTGVGIAPEQQARVFDPFVQVDASTTRRCGGTGLGLGISKRLTRLMGGEIGVRSEPGEGSCFWFALPLCIADSADFGDSGREAEPDADQVFDASVLVAEDNRINRRVAELMLERLGCAVELVPDGAAAVAAVADRRYDLVLMDLEMPSMDGLAATAAIRALPEPAARVPIVALTASVTSEITESCAQAGMNAHLTKPISLDALAAVLGEWTAD
ncbi:MAG: ATP-binding protein [Planctomycetota bacterium]